MSQSFIYPQHWRHEKRKCLWLFQNNQTNASNQSATNQFIYLDHGYCDSNRDGNRNVIHDD